jgi:hypothetical protein
VGEVGQGQRRQRDRYRADAGGGGGLMLQRLCYTARRYVGLNRIRFSGLNGCAGGACTVTAGGAVLCFFARWRRWRNGAVGPLTRVGTGTAAGRNSATLDCVLMMRFRN